MPLSTSSLRETSVVRGACSARAESAILELSKPPADREWPDPPVVLAITYMKTETARRVATQIASDAKAGDARACAMRVLAAVGSQAVRHAPVSAMASWIVGVARAEDADLFAVMLATFSAASARYTGQPEVVVGAPFPVGREGPYAPLIGYFGNPLVMRVGIDEARSFRAQLAVVRDVVRGGQG